jgi:hypothetical protein
MKHKLLILILLLPIIFDKQLTLLDNLRILKYGYP